MNLLDFLFPRRCVNCGRIGNYFCDRCRTLIRAIKSNEPICPMCERPAVEGFTHPRCTTRYSIDGLTGFFHYDGPVRKAVKAVKYRLVSDLAKEFVSLIPSLSITDALTRSRNSCVLIPIPLHPRRFRLRGFNQAEALGAVLAERLQIPMRTDILRRTRETVPQVAMKKRDARLKNMEAAFAVRRGFDKTAIDHQFVKASGLHIVLFDDVFTTGATMRSAANVLKRSGIKHVWAVTMAR